jgi:hypothetical protein
MRQAVLLQLADAPADAPSIDRLIEALETERSS